MNYNQFDHDLLLADFGRDGVFERAARSKFAKSSCVYVSIPAIAYRFEAAINDSDEDFIYRAIHDLNAYYVSKGKPYNYDEISKDLGLGRDLVKVIIKRDSQTIPDEENAETRRISNKSFVVLYDLISRKLMPLFLPVDKYEKYKEFCEDKRHFRISTGDSKLYYIHNLYERGMHNDVPVQPEYREVEFLLREHYYRRKRNVPLSVLFSGNSEYVDVVSALYYDKNNAADYSAAHPFYKGYAGWIVEDVKMVCKKDTETAKRLSEQLNRMKESVDLSIKSHKIKDTLLDECERYVDSVYGKKELSVYPELRAALAESIACYTRRAHAHKEREVMANDRLENANKEYYVAVYTLLEKCIKESFLKNFEQQHLDDYKKYLMQMQTESYCLYDYRKLASEIGFASNAIWDTVRIYEKRLRYLIDRQSGDTDDIDVLLFANLLEAHFSPKHPFHKLARKNNMFFSLMGQARALRNSAKHGTQNAMRWNHFDLQFFALDVFDTLVMPPQNKKLDINKYLDYEGVDEEYQQVDEQAKGNLSPYRRIQNNHDVYNYALTLERSRIMPGSEYFSNAYNILAEVMKQFVYWITDKNEIDKAVLERYLPQEKNKDSVAESVNGILKRYNYPDVVERRYKYGSFNREFTVNMTTGNLLLYLIMVTDYYRPVLLRRLLSENEEFVSLAERIFELRGHNETSKKNEDEIEKIHKKVLTLCETLLDYIESEDNF